MTGTRWYSRFLPDPGLPRSLAMQSLLFALGSGMYLTGSAVYFKQVVGLSALQIASGFSIGGGLTLLLSVPMGALVDIVGARRSWMLGAAIEGVLFATFPLVRAYWGFLLVISLIFVADVFAQSGRGAYTVGAIPHEIRVRTQAFMRSSLNVGFTVGAGAGAAVLAFHSNAVLNALVLTNAVGLIVNAIFISRLPFLPRVIHNPVDGRKPSRIAVFRDRPILVLTALLGVSVAYGTIFAEVIPLWSIYRTDVPRPLLGGLFAVNTVMAVLLQVPASRGADSIGGAIRLMRWGALATIAACPILLLTGSLHGWATVGALAVAVVLVTLNELWQSSAAWYLFSEVPPADRRGEYLGAMRMGSAAQGMVGPAALTYLALHVRFGWMIIAGVFALVVVAAGPVIGWVARTPRSTGLVIPEQRSEEAAGRVPA